MLILATGTAMGQAVKTHKVKKNETIYGIAHANGITEAELRKANPGMDAPGYVLKKGDVINIPVLQPQSTVSTTSYSRPDDVRQRSIRMGVMLPLHNINGDGKRMVEYYRGLLMACDSLKKEGISIDVYAWNTPINDDLASTLAKSEAAQCDIIVGPLYSSQMPSLSAFCEKHDIMLLIPFSINAPQLATNRHIFQVYQTPDELAAVASRRAAEWFAGYNTIIVNCEDPNSTKGVFTSALRQQLDSRGTRYALTSLNVSDGAFASAFSLQKQNVVVLNSSRTDDLRVTFLKLKDLTAANPAMKVSVLGYTEWMELAEDLSASFHKYNMYIPAPFYTNLSSPLYLQLARKYRSNFNQDMIGSMPRFAMTGFDHGMFFLRGLHKYGKTFDGAAGRFGYQPVQTPLKFEQNGNGGHQNKTFMFIHYKPDHQIDMINY